MTFALAPVTFLRTMLGIPEADTGIDWNQVIFNGLTIKGIYGREMYETWYKMEEAFEVMRSGQPGKVVLDWREE